MKYLLVMAALVLSAGYAAATTITAEVTGSGNGFGHAQVDSVTGKVYVHNDFNGNAGTFGYYNSVADYETKSGFTAVTVSGDMPWGSYFSANNDVITARADSSSTTLRTFNGTTGASIASASIAGHCGNNGSCTFDWGGFSAMNLLQDQTGSYLLGVDTPNGNWVLSSIADDLSVTQISTFDKTNSNDGYAFMIGGTLFLGNNFFTSDIDLAYNTLTDTFFDPDIDLETPLSLSKYHSSTFYDSVSDTLFLQLGSTGTQSAKVANASVAFNVSAPSAVPLPAGGFLLLSGFAGFAALRRRQKRAA